MDAIWYDAEAYRGISDEPSDYVDYIPALGMDSPCEGCPLMTECGKQGTACKGYRNWVLKGKYEDGDIGTKLKVLT